MAQLRRISAAPLSALVAIVALGACIAVSPTGIHRITDQGGGGTGGTLDVDGSAPPPNPDPDSGSPDPHQVIGADPSHGPFLGGQRVLIRGKGFSSQARIWFGTTEVDESKTIPVDPTRVQVVAPPGTGSVDITVQNADDGSTRRTLPGGYTYDALYAVPDEGPIPGGTVIEIAGQGTSWDATTVAKIDNKPCTTLTVDSPTHLTCTVPAGTPGSKAISVATGAETIIVLDGFTYQDSDNGYKGGLSGAPLAGQLKVLVYDNYTGDAIPSALVVVGGDISTALQATSDASGVAVINDGSLTTPQTVTVVGKCHSPISFVSEPVDTVTAYLDPVLSPACASGGDPPPVGGKLLQYGEIQGELVWPQQDEFKKGNWTNVPLPIGPNEHQAAYVFVAAGDPTYPFQLPSPSSAVTPDSPGMRGFGFTLDTAPGNRSIYAVAGIEDDTKSPPSFVAYAFGAVSGVPVLPLDVTTNVYISMDKTLDQDLGMSVHPPSPGPKGPDRLTATVAVRLGPDGYALLPGARKSPYLPVMGLVDIIGLPALDGSLTGTVYVASARAVTGASGTAPMSVIGQMITNNTAQPLDASGFVNVPQLIAPATNAAWDGMHIGATFPPGGAPIDLTVVDVVSGNGLEHWLVASAGGSQTVTLPDLSGFPDFAFPHGPVNIAVYGAKIKGFDFSKLLYRQMRPQGMDAYALDYFDAHY